MSEAPRNMSILIVEDEPVLRQTIARSLSARGHSVAQAGSFKEAIAATSISQPEMLLLDINLPDATGWDVLRELRNRGRSIPTVVVSAVPPSAQRVREFQPFGVLYKPFPMDALLRLVSLIAAGAPRGGYAAD